MDFVEVKQEVDRLDILRLLYYSVELCFFFTVLQTALSTFFQETSIPYNHHQMVSMLSLVSVGFIILLVLVLLLLGVMVIR